MNNNYTSPSATIVDATAFVSIILHAPLADSPSLSVKDKQLNSTFYLKEVSERLKDVTVELKKIIILFDIIENLSRNQTLALTALRKTIILFLDKSTKNIKSASKTFFLSMGLNMYTIGKRLRGNPRRAEN